MKKSLREELEMDAFISRKADVLMENLHFLSKLKNKGTDYPGIDYYQYGNGSYVQARLKANYQKYIAEHLKDMPLVDELLQREKNFNSSSSLAFMEKVIIPEYVLNTEKYTQTMITLKGYRVTYELLVQECADFMKEIDNINIKSLSSYLPEHMYTSVGTQTEEEKEILIPKTPRLIKNSTQTKIIIQENNKTLGEKIKDFFCCCFKKHSSDSSAFEKIEIQDTKFNIENEHSSLELMGNELNEDT